MSLSELNGHIVIDGYLKPVDGYSERLLVKSGEEATFHSESFGDHAENYVVIRETTNFSIKRVINFGSIDILKFKD